jgi:hypothetical protein
MHTHGWKLGLLAALIALTPAVARADDAPTAADDVKAKALEQPPSKPLEDTSAKFDMNVVVADTSSKRIKMERTGPARDFIQRAAVYLRYIPVKENSREHPAFITSHNYLTCPDKDKRWPVEGVSRVDFDKASAIAVYGFFFSRPECDHPTFHMEAIIADEPVKKEEKKS